ncbi:AP2/ERF domain-containing protein [Psidium guajava]|nr:AP2/ERF domain-containing protein [Psidium guajava]
MDGQTLNPVPFHATCEPCSAYETFRFRAEPPFLYVPLFDHHRFHFPPCNLPPPLEFPRPETRGETETEAEPAVLDGIAAVVGEDVLFGKNKRKKDAEAGGAAARSVSRPSVLRLGECEGDDKATARAGTLRGVRRLVRGATGG